MRSLLLSTPEAALLELDAQREGRGKTAKVPRQALHALLTDFDRLVAAAKENGLQLDFPDTYR